MKNLQFIDNNLYDVIVSAFTNHYGLRDLHCLHLSDNKRNVYIYYEQAVIKLDIILGYISWSCEGYLNDIRAKWLIDVVEELNNLEEVKEEENNEK